MRDDDKDIGPISEEDVASTPSEDYHDTPDLDGAPAVEDTPEEQPAAAADTRPPAATEPSAPAAERSPTDAEIYARSGETAIEALIRLTSEHSRAAEAGDPDQPRVLNARRMASRAVQSSVTDMAELAMRAPAYIDVISADLAEIDPQTISDKRIAALISGGSNWTTMNAETRHMFADPVAFYSRAKLVHAQLSGTTRAAWRDAAEIDLYVKRYASGLANHGQIVDLAMQNPVLARACLADAGVTADKASPAAIAAARPRAEAYLNADRQAVMALNAGDWVAYGAAARARLLAMNEIYGDSTALVALGSLAGERSIDIRGKAAADLATIRAQREPGGQGQFDERLKQFEADFLKDLTIEGSDPVKRWIKIQNEIKGQELAGGSNGANLAYLRKISEKTSLEVVANPDNYKRIAQSRPDLMKKLVMEGEKGRESALTIGKESAVVLTMDGRVLDNEAAALRNKGASAAAAAAAAPAAARVDTQTAEINAEINAQIDTRNQAERPGLKADPADRILASGGKPRPAQPLQGQASQQPGAQPGAQPGQQAGQAQPGSPQQAGGQSAAGAAKPGQASAQPPKNWATKPLTEAQKKARQHTSQKHPEYDEDKNPHFKFDARAELGVYVNARTPYTIASLTGQLHDTRKLVFAVPLSSFSSDHHRKFKAALREVATNDPDRFRAMYQATKDTWNDWSNAPGERNKVALDQLELGRRILAEVGVKTGVIPIAKAAHHAKPLMSRTSNQLNSNARWDPGDYMQKRDAKRYAAFLTRVAAGAAVHGIHKASAAGWRKAGEMLTQSLTRGGPNAVKKAANALADFVT